MSDYIIHNIQLTRSNERLDFEAAESPSEYLGNLIGQKSNKLTLFRTRHGKGKEEIENCVLRNEGGIALIRIHNKENLTIYGLPKQQDNAPNECIAVSQESYPYGYVVVDYRDGRCQIAIEKTSAWDSNTVTIRNSLEDFFKSKLLTHRGIDVEIKEKYIATEFEQFIDERTIDYSDIIETFTFEFVNIKRSPTVRIPEKLTEQMELMSQMLEYYHAISGTTTMKMGEEPDKEKIKLLATVVSTCADNAFNLKVKFRDYGEYTCNENILARFQMNELVIKNYMNHITPDIRTKEHDLETWLDEVFEEVRRCRDDKKIPTKPR